MIRVPRPHSVRHDHTKQYDNVEPHPPPTPPPVYVDQELDATAVYHGLATKHPAVPKLARQMRADDPSSGRRSGSLTTNGVGVGGSGDGDVSGMGGRRSSGGVGTRRGSEISRESGGKGRRSSKVGPRVG